VEGGPLKVLVVDDEEMIRSVTSSLLRVLGHEPVLVESGEEAIRLLADPRHGIDLVLLDENMQPMDGWATLKSLDEVKVRIPVILCSGRPIELEEYSDSLSPLVMGTLLKPYSLTSLRGILSANA
jgi:DNA-binding NtrC family response regulator